MLSFLHVFSLNIFKQVSQLGVRLLQGDEQVQHIPLDLGSPVSFASSADPYVVILTEDGQIMLLTLREGRGETKLHVTRPQISLVRLNLRKKNFNFLKPTFLRGMFIYFFFSLLLETTSYSSLSVS